MTPSRDAIDSVCVYCGSSSQAAPPLLADARRLGEILAAEKLRLVYGGGGVGLMGACAGAAHEAGGQVLGVIPRFLTDSERPLSTVRTLIVETMHERKMRMFNEADAFIVLPGGIGTLEEAIELLSWRRLGLHAKPIAFYNPDDFWAPLFTLFERFIDTTLTPPAFAQCWRAVTAVDLLLPTLRAMPREIFIGPPKVADLV